MENDFSATELAFFRHGEAIESGAIELPEEARELDARGPLLRTAGRPPVLVAAAGVVLVSIFFLGASERGSEAVAAMAVSAGMVSPAAAVPETAPSPAAAPVAAEPAAEPSSAAVVQTDSAR